MSLFYSSVVKYSGLYFNLFPYLENKGGKLNLKKS